MNFVRQPRPTILAASVAIIAILVYANSLSNQFAYDDEWIITDRPLVHGVDRIGEVLTAEYWPGEFDSGLYRPITLVSFAVDWEIWDGNAFGFHLTNIVLHAVVSALIVFLLMCFFPPWYAWAGGMVFAVHALHTEAVANVVGRGELLAAMFVILAALVYTRAARDSRRFRPAVIALLAACYAAAGFSKEVGFVMPGLLLATDLPLLARGTDLRRYLRERLALFSVLTVVLVLLFIARSEVLGAALQGVPDRAFTLDDSFSTRLFTMARVWPRYLALLVFPHDLSADYSPAVILPVDQLTAVGALGFFLLISIAAVAAASFRKAPELSTAVVWAAISILPVSNLVVSVEIILAERTLYLPSVAVSFVVATLLAALPAVRRKWLGVAIAAWVLFFSYVAVERNSVWYNTDTVFEDLRKKHPESSRVLWGVASQFHSAGNWPEARKWYRRSLEVWPYAAQQQAEFAAMLIEDGELDEAEQRAVHAVEWSSGIDDYHKLLITIRLRAGDGEGALAAADAALVIFPADAYLYVLQALSYALAGRPTRALAAQETSVRIDPSRWKAWLGLANYRLAYGDTAAALIALAAARRTPAQGPAWLDSLWAEWAGEGEEGGEGGGVP